MAGMTGSFFGHYYRVATFGESHGPAVGVMVEGLPAGIEIDTREVAAELARRRPGTSEFTSARSEPDEPEVLSGLKGGRTTGAPIAVVVRNTDARPRDYEPIADLFRPGHADITYRARYDLGPVPGGGRASGRETVARVAAGALARQALRQMWGVEIMGGVVEIAGIRAAERDWASARTHPLACTDPGVAEQMARAVRAAMAEGDSVGGIVEVVAMGVPAGWGEPVFGKLDAALAAAVVSIGGVKGVEFGAGFGAARMRGSEHNDPITPTGMATNNAGGILGGISTGEPIVLRLAVKPTPSIRRPQPTIDTYGQPATITVPGGHDPCICPRIVPVAEAMVAIVLMDAALARRAGEPLRRE